jgi:hypothetical protein
LLVRILPKSLAWPNCTSSMGAAASGIFSFAAEKMLFYGF